MSFNDSKILRHTSDELEVQTPEGPATLRGHDPSLIEYETLNEAKEDKQAELTKAAYADFDAIFPDEWREVLYAIAVNDQTRIKQGRDVMGRLKTLKDEAKRAKSLSELETVNW